MLWEGEKELSNISDVRFRLLISRWLREREAKLVPLRFIPQIACLLAHSSCFPIPAHPAYDPSFNLAWWTCSCSRFSHAGVVQRELQQAGQRLPNTISTPRLCSESSHSHSAG